MAQKNVLKVLTIAGSDSLAGGGLQADLATFAQAGLAGFSALTAIVTIDPEDVQVFGVDDAILAAQLRSLNQIDDFAAIKVGLLTSVTQLDLVVDFLRQQTCPIVVDPVLALKEGELAENPALVAAYRERLLPLATVITPNLNEAALLSDQSVKDIQNTSDLTAIALGLSQTGRTAALVKGGLGFLSDETLDVLVKGEEVSNLSLPALPADSFINGAGCTLAAAVTANLALGHDLKAAVSLAQNFVHQAIQAGYPINSNRLDGNVFQPGQPSQ
ncbi:hydroxymethylpyrimidine/phosphomethylpyrimidine kinase [Fructobacillus ficulneus]|uniref:pyridoxal kinase n=1 Tax=Fructobacillus ficulneus TaxID=157463 RepID=A0A0K8MJS2_9LACO|nr:hydroxymethylpyrimidine/phosphomethylpyrimidine kinase [Fructobacillus ficulneus]GAP00424.1 phosphomethylpyrimidine kinase [Fructobacillus ficulneus]